MVVGGGPVGATLGLMVPGSVVLEMGSFPRDKPCGEGLLPAGVQILERVRVDLAKEGFPALRGVSYRVPGGGAVRAQFEGTCGRGVRRMRLDSLLADRASVVTGCRVLGLRAVPGGVEVQTTQGPVGASAVVATDGAHSVVARQLGWWRPGFGRYGLVGHLRAPGGDGEIEVTILGGQETYRAPVGAEEVLVAVLAGRHALREPASSREDRYRRVLARAHPELAGAELSGRVWGAGPFQWRPATVARGRVFLAGDAAGFVDPLTGDGITAGLQQASVLAGLLADGLKFAAPRYRRWWRSQWRRRQAVGRLARWLCADPERSRRVVATLSRRPQALQRLIALNEGSSGWSQLSPADWMAVLPWGRL